MDIDEAFILTATKLTEHNITWWLWGGSLIGAIRDKKRMPWDVDYDIGFWVKDCKKVYLALRELNEKGLIVTGNLFMGVANEKGEHYICIMPHKMKRGRVYSVTGIFGLILHVLHIPIRKLLRPLTHSSEENDTSGGSKGENILLLQLLLLMQWVQVRFNFRFYYRGTTEEYGSFIIREMEGINAPVPIGYHELLTRDYGDYMTPNSDLNTCFNGTDLDGWRKRKIEETKRMCKLK